jgi:hypothetical protein
MERLPLSIVHLSLLCFSLTPTFPPCTFMRVWMYSRGLVVPFPFPHLRSCQRTTVMTSPSVLQVVHLLCRLVLHHSNQGRIKFKYWFFYQKFPVQNCSKICTKSKQKCLVPTIARIQVLVRVRSCSNNLKWDGWLQLFEHSPIGLRFPSTVGHHFTK